MKSLLVLIPLILAGCSSSQQPVEYTQSPGACNEKLSQSQGMKLSMAQQAFSKQQYYSTLAMLKKMGTTSVSQSALQAKALLKTSQWDEASKVYDRLLDTCLKGEAAHGLGLISAYRQNYQQAGKWLRLAVDVEPDNSAIRNDYGFFLLLNDDTDAAKREFLTALELNPNNHRSAKNLWLALSRDNDRKGAQSLIKRYGWGYKENRELVTALRSFNPLSREETEQ